MRAVVTGSSSGIGKAIAEQLLQEGWDVTGLDLAPAPISHAAFHAVRVDLTDAQAVDAAIRPLAGVRALVHCAGVLRVAPLGELRQEDADLMWRLHVASIMRIANSLVPTMPREGRVVLVGSRVSQGAAARSQYAATKAALVAMARSWAAEVVARGITVNVVSPAATETAMIDDPARKAEPPKLPPIGRLIKPTEIASLVAYLLSPPAAAITGQEIVVCGGASLPR